MANKMITMNKLRQILRLYTQQKGKKFISGQTGVARNTIKKYIAVFKQLRMSFQELNALPDQQLNELFGKKEESIEVPKRKEQLLAFFPGMDKALSKTGMTREKLWSQYLAEHPDGYRYTQFCISYRLWQKKFTPSMHMVHKAGDKLFIDFAGTKPKLVDKETGERREVEFFAAILGCSQLVYAEACYSQQKIDFITASENALHYMGGVPQAIVSDNLKSAVDKSCRYEPTLNETFEDFGDHYQTTILPARAYRPKDKSLVEGVVKILYNRIYSNMHGEEFTSLEQLNDTIRFYLKEVNAENMKGRNYSREQKFMEMEKDILQPLPQLRYEFKRRTVVTVIKNGHVCLNEDKHYYSVPFKFIGKKVKVIYSRSSVEIFYLLDRIAIHQRIRAPYGYTTLKDHMASTHRFVAEWSAETFIAMGEAIHPDVKLFIEKVLDKKQHPEQAYKSCMGILATIKKVGKTRLIDACSRALDYGQYNYKIIQTILEKGLDQYKETESEQDEMPNHENIRGEDYYQ
ncbi:MAG: IS21 family transposase [Crocinitomicaceae bacterium]|nr:IS21 family transposase [Crocinitomicaceae bacterium]